MTFKLTFASTGNQLEADMDSWRGSAPGRFRAFALAARSATVDRKVLEESKQVDCHELELRKQNRNKTNGSLSSTASSSGCSSVESSSMELPAKLAQADQKESLEVDESVYLRCSSVLPEEDRGGCANEAMSQFCALTLRKSLKSVKREEQSEFRGAIRGRSEGALAKQTPSSGRRGYCCCCSGDCSAATKPFQSGASDEDPPRCSARAEQRGAHWRRATMLARPTPDNPTRGRGRVGATRRGARPACGVQRARARRSVPVPPPVVPLYKEMALLEDRGGLGEDPPRRSAPPREAQSLLDLQGASNADSKAAAAADDEEPNNKRLHCDNWQDLGAFACQQQSAGLRRGSKVSQSCLAIANHWAPDEASKAESFGNTLGRRTERILQRLKHTFLANFSQQTSVSTTATATTTTLHNNIQSGAEQRRPEAGGGFRASWTRTDEPAAEPIYDTPEYDAQAPLLRACGPIPAAVRPTIPPPAPPSPGAAAHSQGESASARANKPADRCLSQLVSFEFTSSAGELKSDRDLELRGEQSEPAHASRVDKRHRKAVKWAEQRDVGFCGQFEARTISSERDKQSRKSVEQQTVSAQDPSRAPRDNYIGANKQEEVSKKSLSTFGGPKRDLKRKGILLKQQIPSTQTISKLSPDQQQAKGHSIKMGSNQSAQSASKPLTSSLNKSSRDSTDTENSHTSTMKEMSSCEFSIKALPVISSKLANQTKLKSASVTKSIHKIASSSNNHLRLLQQQPNGKFKATKSIDKADKKASTQSSNQLFDQNQVFSLQDTLDKRRKSIQNGDVFIYPSLYKDLNQCSNCLRDYRVCNCNNEQECAAQDTSAARASPSFAINNQLSSHSSAANSSLRDSNKEMTRVDGARSTKSPSSKQKQPPQGLQAANSVSSDLQANSLVASRELQVEQQLKTYKISITTASIDQKNNQLRLSTPKIIVPKRSCNLMSPQLSPSLINGSEICSSESPCPLAMPRLMRDQLNHNDQHNLSSKVSLSSHYKASDIGPIHLSPDTSSIEPANETLSLAPLGGATRVERTKTQATNSSSCSADEMSHKNQNSEVLDSEPIAHEARNCSLNRSRLLLLSTQTDCKYESNSSNYCNNKPEAKVTAISVGTPTATLASLDYEKLLPPLMVTNCDNVDPSCKSANLYSLDRNNNNNNTNTSNNCDIETTNNVDQDVNGMVKDESEQLTCNLSVGDSIQITSTSIKIGGNQIPHSSMLNSPIVDKSLTSIVPIQTLSTRRRNMTIGRQAIMEDDDPSLEICKPLASQRILLTNQIDIVDLLQPGADKQRESNGDVLEYSPILTSARDYIKNVNTELQVQTSTASQTVGELSVVSNSDTNLIMSPVMTNDSLQVIPGVAPTSFTSVLKTGDLESPKKSIFEGASKDEILEYLEDARERVPGILMAADDVMVINENELIVVNQLEPNSPATPISIIETSEVIVDQTSSSALDSDIQAHPDQLREHLRKMYQTSQMAASPFGSANDTMDEDKSTISDSLNIKLDSSCGTNDIALFDESNKSNTKRVCGDLKSYSRLTGETLESLDDQVASLDNQLIESVNETQTEATDLQQSRRNMIATEGSNSSTCEPGNSGLLTYSSSIYVGRRNSTSETSSDHARNSAIQLMMLQQRYSNHDSLSSSSPPSSASPISSTSSNQTSGNCSVASTFYASSSLSCSSPLLALSSVTSNSSTFNKLISNTTSANRYEYDNSSYSSARGTQPEPTSDIISPDFSQSRVERDDSGLGVDFMGLNKNLLAQYDNRNLDLLTNSQDLKASVSAANEYAKNPINVNFCSTKLDNELGKLSIIDELGKGSSPVKETSDGGDKANGASSVIRFPHPKFYSSANLLSRTLPGHYSTLSRLNNYFMNRHPLNDTSETTVEFQCLDCDQFIDVDQATMLHKANELKLLKESESQVDTVLQEQNQKDKPLTPDQLDRAYIAAMNGLPLCKSCEKKRIERKEIISEFVETELKYGRDLKIIHDEFYRPMQIAGLLSKDQINGVFLNLEELIIAHCKFADRLETALSQAHSMGDTDYSTVNIGRLFVGSAEMLHAFESYCIRQGSAACLLARLAKEKELLRIFLRVSQMENTLLRRMNLAAFLMVPVQRVTKYPLLINRLYKVTAYHHKDRETLRDAQLKVELHLEHINHQTKGVGATNKIWRRISNLSAPISSRRGLLNAEDIGYIKLRKTAMDMLRWDRDETQFIHSGRINFAPLNEFLIKQKMKPMRYMAAHALLIVLGKPNWKYRPDLVKSNLDSKLMTPTPGGNGIKETALLLFREKNGRFIPCREPLFLSNCVLSNDCSQFNSEFPLNQPNHSHNSNKATNSHCNNTGRRSTTSIDSKESSFSSDSKSNGIDLNLHHKDIGPSRSLNSQMAEVNEQKVSAIYGDTVSMSSLKSLPEDKTATSCSPPATHPSRSYSLASALPRTTITATTLSSSLTKSTSTTTSNLTILNQLMTKVNSYHKQTSNGLKNTSLEHNSNNKGSVAAIIPPLAHVDSNIQRMSATQTTAPNISHGANAPMNHSEIPQNYNHHYFHNHHQPYGDYEESFEIHERLTKESMLLRADTPLKTRYWLQMLRYHAKDLGQWRSRRNGLANIMMMRQD